MKNQDGGAGKHNDPPRREPSVPKDSPIPHQKHQHGNDGNHRSDRHEYWMLGSQLFLGIVGFAAVAVTGYQAKLSREALEFQRQAFAAEHRAWISPVPGVPAEIESETPNIGLKNDGHVPAFIDAFHIQRSFFPGKLTGLPPILPSENQITERHVIAPGNTGRFGGTANPITPKMRASAMDGSFTLYVLGNVQYRDIFGDGYLTTYCWYWEPDVTAWVDCPFGIDMK